MSLLTNLFRLIPPSFRAGYCPASLQQFANDLINGTQLTFLIQSGNFFYNMGSTTPLPENRIYPWLYTPNGRWYTFQFGLWVSPMDPGSREPGFRRMWKPAAGTLESALWSLDEGDGTDPSAVPATATTGAAWQVDHDLDNRIPIGAGTTAAVSVNAGAADVTLNSTNLPSHNHEIGVVTSPEESDSEAGVIGAGDGIEWSTITTTKVGFTRNAGELAPSNFSIIPPVTGVYWIKSTIKIWYTLPA